MLAECPEQNAALDAASKGFVMPMCDLHLVFSTHVYLVVSVDLAAM